METTPEYMAKPRKPGIAKLGAALSNLSAGAFSAPVYARRPLPDWQVAPGQLVVIADVSIVDVRNGTLRPERNLVLDGERIEGFATAAELGQLLARRPGTMVVTGRGRFAIPGLSDLHAHLSLISEFDMSVRSIRHFDSQRQRNCEEALLAGCTFVRDSGGAFATCSWLKDEIDAGRLLGPRIAPSYEVLTPRGGMWDLGRIGNAMAPMIFGGKIINYVSSDDGLRQTCQRLADLGCAGFKTYFEQMPLFGGTRDTRYAMYSRQQAHLLRELADHHGKPLEAHSMFLEGSRIVAEAGFDSIAHLTVDGAYTPELARTMARNHTAIVPTLSLGCYMAMSCGDHGSPHHPDYQYFREQLRTAVPQQIGEVTIPELRGAYEQFQSWLLEDQPDRAMPMVGEVYADRVHGFAVHAAESLRNLRDAGVKIGVGTDGGTGITFAGRLEVELAALAHFGFSTAEILRMATLGNMEILGRDDELGSLDGGKLADVVLLEDNPLECLDAIRSVDSVFKGGRLVAQAAA